MAYSEKGLKRRDFLAGAGALALSLPMLPRVALANIAGSGLAPKGTPIHRLGIYPTIGISRVGGSEKYFLAPEVPGLPPQPQDGSFKDGSEKIKKQAQRFRIYAFAQDGRVIKEITADEATIDWTVHVANTKAAWYGFNNPMDNEDLAPGIPGQKRNQYFSSQQQREDNLVIDGGATSITGSSTNQSGGDERYAMQGTFWGLEIVGLGQLRTDKRGRLLMVPPDGISKSPMKAGITSFADNDGWCDDWCDGPVQAAVTMKDGTFSGDAEPAWVACVGPNFAPEIPPVSTMYDVIYDMNVKNGWQTAPETPSFTNHIYPTFHRLGLMQWLSNAANLRASWMDKFHDFSDKSLIDSLSSNDVKSRELRQEVFEQIRIPYELWEGDSEAYLNDQRFKLPYMLGEGINYDGSPLGWFQMSHQQYKFLQQWRDGDFINDWKPDDEGVQRFDDIPLDQQPSALTQAALEPLSGGAFHPGVELTYYLRHPNLYARAHQQSDEPNSHPPEPFRVALGSRSFLAQDFGPLLTPELVLQGDDTKGIDPAVGPSMPGDMTRWMGLPWQCDSFSCQQVLMRDDFPTAVWWPALLPVDVLPEGFFENQVVAGLSADGRELSRDERLKFFNQRADWKRGVAGIGYHATASYWDGITNMITLWQHMGFVVKQKVPEEVARKLGIPAEAYVEVGRGDMELRF